MPTLQELFASSFAALLEGREDYIIANQGEQLKTAADNDQFKGSIEELLAQFKKLDPTQGKCLQWIANQYIADNFRLEDGPRVSQALSAFTTKKLSLDKKDINQYKTLSDLEDVVHDAPAPEASAKQAVKLTKSEADKVFEDSHHLVVIPRTHAASVLYGKGTKWCTTAKTSGYFDHYTEMGPLYIIIDKVSGAKCQWHAPTGQFKQANDSSVSPADTTKLLKAPVGKFLVTVGLLSKVPKAMLLSNGAEYMSSPGSTAEAVVAITKAIGRRECYKMAQAGDIDLDGLILRSLKTSTQDGNIAMVVEYINVFRKLRWEAFEAVLPTQVNVKRSKMCHSDFNALTGYIDRFVVSRSDGVEQVLRLLHLKPDSKMMIAYADNVHDFDHQIPKPEIVKAKIGDINSVAALLRLFDQKTRLTDEQLALSKEKAPADVVLGYLLSRKVHDGTLEYMKKIIRKLGTGSHYGRETSLLVKLATMLNARVPTLDALLADANFLEPADVAKMMAGSEDTLHDYEKKLLEYRSFRHILEYAAAGGHHGHWRAMETKVQKDMERGLAETVKHAWQADQVFTFQGRKYLKHWILCAPLIKEYVTKYSPDWEFGKLVAKACAGRTL